MFSQLHSIPMCARFCEGRHKKYSRPSGFNNNRHLFSHGSGSWTLKIKVSAHLISSATSLLGSQMAVFSHGLMWPFLSASVGSLCVSTFPLRRTPVRLDLGPHSWLHFNLILSLKDLSPNTVTIGGTGNRASTCELRWGYRSAPFSFVHPPANNWVSVFRALEP